MHIKLFRPLQSGYKSRRINTAYLARLCSADRPAAHLRPTSVPGEGFGETGGTICVEAEYVRDRKAAGGDAVFVIIYTRTDMTAIKI
ncbi:hypothetical protein E2C01_039197 [Portunus trituberculatus]|uniref:Uncharacterized protein n=1 Tax=Portunus trituberculatus TaxID=210409 RepID=A0A5B7FKQ4_PORTR|nr:hypothetical protein [Portunus trituberculatus]